QQIYQSIQDYFKKWFFQKNILLKQMRNLKQLLIQNLIQLKQKQNQIKFLKIFQRMNLNKKLVKFINNWEFFYKLHCEELNNVHFLKIKKLKNILFFIDEKEEVERLKAEQEEIKLKEEEEQKRKKIENGDESESEQENQEEQEENYKNNKQIQKQEQTQKKQPNVNDLFKIQLNEKDLTLEKEEDNMKVYEDQLLNLSKSMKQISMAMKNNLIEDNEDII
ncbi:hypothetical protein IMG5_057350, partial [Ichthyophthirius multifiliis]